MLSRRGRNFRRFLLAMTALVIAVTICVPASLGAAAQAVGNPAVPSPTMHGYAAGPKQHDGTAAGRSHYVPASATRTGLRISGHSAPKPDLSPPAKAAAKIVQTGETKTSPGHIVTHDETRQGTKQVSLQAALPLAAPAAALAASVADNASYSVASAYDTVPMANQTGRVAVTLINNGL